MIKQYKANIWLVAMSLVAGCPAAIAQAQVQPALASAIAETPVTRLTKQLSVVVNPKDGQITISSSGIISKPPKRAASPEAQNLWKADAAWVVAQLDPMTKGVRISIKWYDAGFYGLANYNSSGFTLPGGTEREGPRPEVDFGTDCFAPESWTDEFGIVYARKGGCADERRYAIPVTLEVLKALASRLPTDARTPLSLFLLAKVKDGGNLRRDFNLYPSEAQAMVDAIDRARTSQQ
jgi:hypothetical protein